MSRNGDHGTSRAGHGPNSNQPRPSLIIKLKIPSLRNVNGFQSSINSQEVNPVTAPSAFPANFLPNAPKRRGRPPKNLPKQENAPPPKPKLTDLPKPLATRSSKRKAAEMSGESGNPHQTTSVDGGDFEASQPPRKKSRSASQAPQTRISTRSRGHRLSTMESGPTEAIVSSPEDEIPNGHVTPTKSLDKDSSHSEREIYVARTSSRAKKQEYLASSNEPMASIEPHERTETEAATIGVTTRAGARTRSASIKLNVTSYEDGNIPSVVAPEETSDVPSGEAECIQLDAGTPKGRGRGRWPNGATKAKVMAAAVISKKMASKKKGAPGKRKTSDDAVVQAVYDRQAHLRSSYKDLRKVIIRAEQALLDRALEELEEDPERHKRTPFYENVMKALDARKTKVLAQGEHKDRLKRDFLQKQFEENVAYTWKKHDLEVKVLQEKYETICKRAIMDILKRAARDDDDTATVTEVDVLDPSKYISAALENSEENDVEEAPTPVELESYVSKRGKTAASKGRKGAKKRSGDDELLGRRVAKRHAPAMLSATTQGAEESEADKAPEAPPVVTTPSRQRSKYQFDEYGVYIPTESKKGAQKEEPNNRAVVKPWVTFTNDEIGLRNYPEEIKESNRGPIPGGHIYLDQFRGIYDLSGKAEDYDEDLINRHLLHPRMGIPVPGSINPDDAVAPTDWVGVLQDTPAPIILRNEDYPEGHSASKSWDVIATEREWKALEKRMDAGLNLKGGLGRRGLATFDAVARDQDDLADVIDDILAASKIIEKEIIDKQADAEKNAAPAPQEATPAEAEPIETEKLSVLADASEMLVMESKIHSPPPPPPPRPVQRPNYQAAQQQPPLPPPPPTPRSQSQMLSIAFINNPSPSHSGLPPLAPQMQQRPYPGPVIMAHPQPPPPPPPPQQPQQPQQPQPPRNLPTQYPPIQPHPPSSFYGASSNPSNIRSSRSSSGLRNILPRGMPNEAPLGPPRQHHHYQQPPPPPPPQQLTHLHHEHQRYYDAPVQLPPYLGEQYQAYRPPGPRQYPPYPPHQQLQPHPAHQPHLQPHQSHQTHQSHQAHSPQQPPHPSPRR